MSNTLLLNEIAYLYHAAYQCFEDKTGNDGAWQVAPFQCSIEYNDDAIEKLEKLREFLRIDFPELIAFGERRAKKAFGDHINTTTKPSYIARLENYIHGSYDQSGNMLNIAEKEPASGGLVFSIFSPQDLVDRKRPGYVPCLVSGSFLLHKNKLQLNAFFRSQSVVEFGLFDMLFLRKFQRDFFEQFVRRSDNNDIKMGSLNLHMGRVLVHRRFVKSNTYFIRRSDIFDQWLGKMQEFMFKQNYS